MNWYKKAQSTQYDQNYFNRIDQNHPIQSLHQSIQDLQTSSEKLKDMDIPRETCPFIDDVIKDLYDAQKSAAEIQKEEENVREIHSYAYDIELTLYSAIREMENIRNANHQLRELGKEWYKQCDNIIDEMIRLADSI